MAIETRSETQIGDTAPCPTCGHVKNLSKRLHEVACAGLESHQVDTGFIIVELVHVLAHRWREEGTYAAVMSDREISESDALAWLERAHAGEVERRPYHPCEVITFDRWED
jgi:hypothetical protein